MTGTSQAAERGDIGDRRYAALHRPGRHRERGGTPGASGDYHLCVRGGRVLERDAVRDFAELLVGLKRRTGRSYEALGRRAGVGASTLHRWCRGERVPLEFAAVGHYARLCGVTHAEMTEVYRRWVRADAASVDPRVMRAHPAAAASDPRRTVAAARK